MTDPWKDMCLIRIPNKFYIRQIWGEGFHPSPFVLILSYMIAVVRECCWFLFSSLLHCLYCALHNQNFLFIVEELIKALTILDVLLLYNYQDIKRNIFLYFVINCDKILPNLIPSCLDFLFHQVPVCITFQIMFCPVRIFAMAFASDWIVFSTDPLHGHTTSHLSLNSSSQ